MTYHPAAGTVRSERGHRALLHAAEQIGRTQYARQCASNRGRHPTRYAITEVHAETVRMLNDRTVTDADIFAWVTSPEVMAERFA